MKKAKIPIVVWLVVLPTFVLCLLLILFAQPKPELTMTDLFREEDEERALHGFQCTIVDNVLADCNYSVFIEDRAGLYTRVYYPVAGGDPVIQEEVYPEVSTMRSALTLGQMQALIQPAWEVLAEDFPKNSTISLMLLSPLAVNESLLTQRKTNMTLSVSVGTVTAVKETYIGTTDYGMICANVTYKDAYASEPLYIMLIP